METLKRKWLRYAVTGILVMGFGLSVMGEAIIAKSLEKPFITWFLTGTVSLSLIFAGLSLFGQAVVYKTLIDQKKKDL